MLAQGPGEAKTNPDNFIKLYPGVYTAKEKPLMEKYFAVNKAIEARGQVDIKALVNGKLPKNTPGIGPIVHVTEAMVRYYNQKYFLDNPLFNNAEYAKKAGLQNIMAPFTFAAHDDSFTGAYPTGARDTLLVGDLIHSVTNYRPVYPGDTLYYVINSRHLTDLTPPEGSIYRSNAIVNKGSVYNQKGEKILDVTYTFQENTKLYKEGKGPKTNTFKDMWEENGGTMGKKGADGKVTAAGGPGGGAPPGMGGTYYYTDKDWATIKDLWSKEKIQGFTPLYWEDVKIGDQPIPTLEGPLLRAPSVFPPWGMGLGGSKTMKELIMNQETFKTMVRDLKDGIYRPANKAEYIPAIPAEMKLLKYGYGEMGKVDAVLNGTADAADDPNGASKDDDESGANMMNFSRRDLALRHFANWMGDKGWLSNIRWGGLYVTDMNARSDIKLPVNMETNNIRVVPASRFHDLVPKDVANCSTSGGGMPGGPGGGGSAFVVVKSVVVDKYVRDGEFYVDLAWWLAPLSGGSACSNSGEGAATIKLPSKSQ